MRKEEPEGKSFILKNISTMCVKITHLNAYFIIFSCILCHVDRYLTRGKNKFNIYSTLVINIIFMILLTQIYII